MFERFTERARQVVVLAQEEARSLSHNYIGTEHILLGLVRENDGVAARIPLSFEVDAERIRNEVIRATQAKQAAATAEKYDAAARFFTEENRLRAELSAATEVGPETIASIRARLGLTPAQPPSE